MEKENEKEKKREKYLLYYNRWGTLKKLINNPIKQIETFFLSSQVSIIGRKCVVGITM